MENRCISCGEIIPEGRQVCERCMRIAETANAREGMIFVDIPETCGDCIFSRTHAVPLQDHVFCTILSQGVICKGQLRPEWCPIKPIPRRKPLFGNVSDIKGIATEMKHIGWNACLDELERGGIGDE